MGRKYELRHEVPVAATCEQVWEAISTGPGIDSWFMGHTRVEHGRGGTVRTSFGDYTVESVVTAWDPPSRLAYRSDESEDGRFIGYEFVIKQCADRSSVLRTVTSGFLPGDDWEAEYDAMTKGLELFIATLVEYLTHLPGRTATPITASGPPVTDWERAWSVVHGELGLSGTPAVGDVVRCVPDGLSPFVGVVYLVNSHCLGVRTKDALYRFLRGFQGPMVVGHHLFSRDVQQAETEQLWESWLTRLLAGTSS